MVVFHSEKISDRITRIYGVFGDTGEQMYLVEGAERAALIDTGSGVGDLKGHIMSLSKLPVVVLLSHGHVDHGMGTPQFQEIYMSHLDKEIYRAHNSLEMRKSALSSSAKFTALEEEDFLLEDDPDRFSDLRNGARFDLGGVTVEAVSCAGHTPGSMMFLIPEERTLFTGDACNYFTMLQDKSCLGLSTYEQNLKRAHEYTRGQYDTILMSHGRVSAPDTLIEDVLEVCRDIQTGADDAIPFAFMGTDGLVAKAFGDQRGPFMRTDGGFGNIVYDPNRILE